MPAEITVPAKVFSASRWTRGNLFFPTVIEVTDTAVVRRKRGVFSMNEMSIHLQKIASVRIKTGLIWSDLLIESSGGTDPIASHGHQKADAIRIKDLIESSQARRFAASTSEAADTKVCPFCAETIKSAAKICRFCNRDL